MNKKIKVLILKIYKNFLSFYFLVINKINIIWVYFHCLKLSLH